jgi:hypothetical protein
MIRQEVNLANNLFLINRNEKTELYRVQNKRIQHIAFLPFPQIDFWSISENGTIAGCKFRQSFKKNSIHLAELKPDNSIQNSENIQLSAGFKIHSLRFYRKCLFVCGVHRSNNYSQFAGYFENNNGKWDLKMIPLPENHSKRNKSIDEVLIWEDNLYLVDDLVLPKYLYHFTLSETDEPQLVRTICLPAHGSYEVYYSGKISSKWLALFSRTENRYGVSYIVSVFDRITLQEIMQIKSRVAWQDNNASVTEFHWFADYALKDDNLYLACYEKGLGIISIKDNNLQANIEYKIIDTISNLEKLVQVNENLVTYHSNHLQIIV